MVTPPDKDRFDRITTLVYEERIAQNEKWGWPQDITILPEWMSILGEEFGEACQAANETYFAKADTVPLLAELIQVAAVVFAALEALNEQNEIVL